ncbi:Lipoyl ligase [Perkinsus chesapeaki]|uniref:Lipoyl ligase n=1 Tax=Perkinsus chesapeaki TaxID=330153 RepID=A0A7J6LLX4_PERCH|nr:Lipoyl ligase [Perkinsus chesapeaki]
MSLKVAAAYCMAYVAGQESPSEADVKKILESVNAPVDEEQIKSLVSQLEGKDIAAVIKEGKEKLSACAGAAPAAAGKKISCTLLFMMGVMKEEMPPS